MSLSVYEQRLANELFTRFADFKFAVGVYETGQPLTYSTTATSGSVSYSGSYNYIVKTKQVECEALVPGLNQDAFIEALTEFLEQSRQHTFDILAKEY